MNYIIICQLRMHTVFAFFYAAIAKFNQGYTFLFGTQDKEGNEEGEGTRYGRRRL